MREQDLEMADILLSLSREAPLDTLKAPTVKMPEYMRSVSMTEADRATQTQSVEELLRRNWVDRIFEHPMYYTSLKSKELLQYLFEIVQDKADS